MVAASSLVLSALMTPPVMGMPKWHSNISGMLGSMTATVSPLPMPRCASAEPSRRTRSQVSAQV